MKAKLVKESLFENMSQNFIEYFEDMSQEEKNKVLINASKRGHTEMVKVLIDAGADVHVENDLALRYASENGHTEIVKLLLDAGASINEGRRNDNSKVKIVKESNEDFLKPKNMEDLDPINKKIYDVYKYIKDLGYEVQIESNFYNPKIKEIRSENYILSYLPEEEKDWNTPGIDAEWGWAITNDNDGYMVIEGSFLSTNEIIEIFVDLLDNGEIAEQKYLRENWGGRGAGYAVWGGGTGRNFGNPSMRGGFAGRGFGFGGSMNLSGGPNLMYTYSVKPLSPVLQQQLTPQDDSKYIHVGSKIKGKIMNTNKDIKGSIIRIE